MKKIKKNIIPVLFFALCIALVVAFVACWRNLDFEIMVIAFSVIGLFGFCFGMSLLNLVNEIVEEKKERDKELRALRRENKELSRKYIASHELCCKYEKDLSVILGEK